MTVLHDVFERLLVAKDLLEKIRHPVSRPDRATLARHILTAHDAAELTAAGIARQLDCLPRQTKTYLMDYIASIEDKVGKKLHGRDYLLQLNEVRIGIKHRGIFPDPKQWHTAGERTYDYLSLWCEEYIGVPLSILDDSTLITDVTVKKLYGSACDRFVNGDYKVSLELISLALKTLFNSNLALKNLIVGSPRSEDAIKLAAFGVHSNDYIAMQEFIPRITIDKENRPHFEWEQEKYGHPANWASYNVEFCLKTFVTVAIRIQDAEWIPGAVHFLSVYQHKITALEDGVQIIQEKKGYLEKERLVACTLNKGEFLVGHVKRNYTSTGLLAVTPDTTYRFMSLENDIFGDVEADKIRITCIPLDSPMIRKHYPDLAEIDYEPPSYPG